MKAITYFLAFAFIMSLLSFSGCSVLGNCEKGSKNIISDSRNFTDFTKVILKGSYNLYIKQSEKDSVIVETDDNMQKHIELEHEGDILVVKTEGNICPTSINIYVSMKEVKGFKIEGSGDCYADGNIKTDNLILTIAGSGNISFKGLIAEKVKAEILGSGDIILKGKTDKLTTEISGSGDINCEELETNGAKVDIKGSGDCKVFAKEALDIDIKGSGNVYYKGNPPAFKTSTHGMGDIIKINEK